MNTGVYKNFSNVELNLNFQNFQRGGGGEGGPHCQFNTLLGTIEFSLRQGKGAQLP